MESQRIVHRSTMSLLIFLTAAVATGGLFGGGWSASSHGDEAQGIRTTHAMEPGSFYFCALATLCAGVVVEWLTQRQIRLVRDGGLVRSIISEIRSDGDRKRAALYDFVADDGRSFSGKVPLTTCNGLSLKAGVPVAIFYDRQNPARNAVAEALWCVEWTEAESESPPASQRAA